MSLMLLVGSGVHYAAEALASDCVASDASTRGKSAEVLKIHQRVTLVDLQRFKSLSGCEWDDIGITSCSIVGAHGEVYVIFDSAVMRVDVGVTESAFKFCEFAGLSAQANVEGVKRWTRARDASVGSGSPADARNLPSVLAVGFRSRWCESDCDAEFLFTNGRHLKAVRIVTKEPYF